MEHYTSHALHDHIASMVYTTLRLHLTIFERYLCIYTWLLTACSVNVISMHGSVEITQLYHFTCTLNKEIVIYI